jgi:hypothetical protein
VIYDIIIKGKLEALISVRPSGTGNNPPAWDQQPNPVFVNGTASNYDVGALVSDLDSDPTTVSFTPGDALQSSVTWNDSLDRFEYDGTDDVSQSTGHQCTASDGTDTTVSNTFNVQVQAVATAFGFPRIHIGNIGGRFESDAWRDSTFQARLAVSNDMILNFAPSDVTHCAQSVSDIKAINPNVRIATYRNYNAFLLSAPLQVARRDQVVDNWVTPALPGGTATDGMSREPDGTVVSGWPNKEDLNPTDFPNLYNGQLPAVWNAEQVYDEFYTGATATVFDDLFFDIWRWFGRYQDRKADYNRNGVRYDEEPPTPYGDYDPTHAINSSIIRTKVAIANAIQVKANIDRGEDLPILGNLGSWGDWFDGAQAHLDVITSAPDDMVSITEGGFVENWGLINGFNPDGTTRPGSFQRAYKQLQRIVSWIDTSTVTNTVRISAHIEIDATLYDLAAYLTGAATLAGAYINWARSSDHRNPGELDEYFGQDLSAMTTAQKVAALNWMGLPIGSHPQYGDTFQQGVRGGIIQNGVYGMEFDNALLLVNPSGNGTQSVNLPSGTWDYFTGGQRAVNSGLQDVTAIGNMQAATAIFLKRGT